MRGLDRIEYRRARTVLIQTADESAMGDHGGSLASGYPGRGRPAHSIRPIACGRTGCRYRVRPAPWSTCLIALRLERGQTLTLGQPTGTTVVHSSASTLGEALIEAGYELRQGDSIVPQAQTPLAGLASADYRAARPVHIAVDGIET